MGIVRDLYYARKMSAGLKLPAPTVALLIKRLRLAAAMGGGIEKTVSGTMVHITDALAKAALSVLVSIEPIQDLHGYANPWPAGGGKNKFNPDSTDNKWVGADGAIGTRSAAKAVQLAASAGQVWSASMENVRTTTNLLIIVFFDAEDNMLTRRVVGPGSKIVTETAPADTASVLCSAYTYSEAGNVQLELGSVTDFEPYSNICPISGRTGLSVYRTGKNLFNKNATDQNAAHALNPSTATEYSAGSYTVTGFIKVKEGVKYITSGTGGSNDVCFYDESKTRLSGSSDFNEARTAPTGAVWLKFDYKTANADTVQLEQAATATAYEPFGNTYSVDWTSEAGTVYGGTLDVVTGLLTVDRASSIVNASALLNNGSISGEYRVFYHQTGRAFTVNVLCNRFPRGSAGHETYMAVRTNSDGIEFSVLNSMIGVEESDDDNTVKLPAARTWFTNNPVQLVYELATTLTYQLTAQEVQMLLGENNVWSSSGDTVSVTYYAEGNANTLQSLNILLGGNYSNPKTADDVSDKEALEIILGGNK